MASLDWAEKGLEKRHDGCCVDGAGVVLVVGRAVWSRGQSSTLSSSRAKALAPL